MSLQLLSVQQQGFEAGIVGWSANINCSIAQSAAQAHDGTKSLALTSTAAGDMVARTDAIPVMGGRSYTGGAWLRTAVSARSVLCQLFWYQDPAGTVASALHISDNGNNFSDSTSAWAQSSGTYTAPLDAQSVRVILLIQATGAGSEVHYADTISLLDNGSPYFKHGRLANLWLNGVDVSTYFNSADWAAKVAMAPVTTFTAAWDSFIAGQAASTLTASGYYDSADADKVRDTLQAAVGQATYAPAGALAIGDQCRLLNINSSDYKTGSKIGGAVTMDWTAESTAPVGLGECLHVMQSENVGTITGTGSPLLTGVASTTGAVLHVHLTAKTGADTFDCKLQDAIALNGAYTDIAGGAITQMTAVGSQRIVIPGTIRAYVRAVAVVATHAMTYGVAAART